MLFFTSLLYTVHSLLNSRRSLAYIVTAVHFYPSSKDSNYAVHETKSNVLAAFPYVAYAIITKRCISGTKWRDAVCNKLISTNRNGVWSMSANCCWFRMYFMMVISFILLFLFLKCCRLVSKQTILHTVYCENVFRCHDVMFLLYHKRVCVWCVHTWPCKSVFRSIRAQVSVWAPSVNKKNKYIWKIVQHTVRFHFLIFTSQL